MLALDVALDGVQGGADSATDSFTPIPGAKKIKKKDQVCSDNERRERNVAVGVASVFTESQGKLFKWNATLRQSYFRCTENPQFLRESLGTTCINRNWPLSPGSVKVMSMYQGCEIQIQDHSEAWNLISTVLINSALMNYSIAIPLLDIYMLSVPFCSHTVHYSTATADRPTRLGTLYTVHNNLGTREVAGGQL